MTPFRERNRRVNSKLSAREKKTSSSPGLNSLAVHDIITGNHGPSPGQTTLSPKKMKHRAGRGEGQKCRLFPKKWVVGVGLGLILIWPPYYILSKNAVSLKI